MSGIDYMAGLITGWRPTHKGYKGKCPAHGGRSDNSLSVFMRDDGSIRAKCWGGCSEAAVAEALGISVGELRATPPPPPLLWWDTMAERARTTGHVYVVHGKTAGYRVRSTLPGAAVVAVERPWRVGTTPSWAQEFKYLAVWLVSDNTTSGAAFRRCTTAALRGVAWSVHDIIAKGKTVDGWHVTVGPRFKSELLAAIARAGLREVA